jgi:site-specific recombinase XerD
MNSSTFGIHFVLKMNKTINDLAPIYARITVDTKRCEVSVKQKISVSNWNFGKGMAKSNLIENKQLNSYLEQVRKMMVQNYQELILNKHMATPEAIKNKFLGLEVSDMTLCKLIEYHNLNSKETLRWGTLKNYFTTQKYIGMFLNEKYKTSDIHLASLNYKFLAEFEHFLRQYSPVDHQRPMENNTVMKHIERLKKMIKMAIRYEWLEKDPFIAFKQRFNRFERGFLTSDELKRIEEKTFSISRLQYVKDLFVFSCYTGLSYIDVVQLSPEHVQVGEDKEYWLITKREKTDNPVRIPILPVALGIINKYKNDPRSIVKNSLFPNISNQKLNSYLKEIADLCEISKNMTFHLARHTFATTVTLTNGVPIESVSKMLGHSKISTTQIYAKVIEKKVGEDMKKLKERLKQR